MCEPYDKQYPAYQAMTKAYGRIPNEVFAQADGVSDYSKTYWDGWFKGNVSTESALHETLAEMNRIKFETGHFPEHRFAGPFPHHNATEEYPEGFATTEGVKEILAKGAKAWRELYKVVNS